MSGKPLGKDIMKSFMANLEERKAKRLAAASGAPEPKKARAALPGAALPGAALPGSAPLATPPALSAQASSAAPNKDALIATFISSGAGAIRVGNLNTLIGALYPSAADKAGYVNQVAALDPEFGMPGAYRMFSSGSNCDCLVHSFLTVTCSNFRSLPQTSKNEFASIFRRQMLPRLVNRYPVSEKTLAQIAKFIRDVEHSSGFLADTDTSVIAKLFDINILLIEPARQGNPLTAALVQPRNDSRSNPYVIYGSGVHFEGVRLADGTWQRNYDVSVQNVRRITNVKRGNAEVGCIHEVGTSVMYMGEPYRVIGRTFDGEQNCKDYVLTTNPNLELPAGGLNDAWIAAHVGEFLMIPANAESLFGRRPIGCQFEIDSPVIYQGSPFRVIGRIYDSGRICKSYVITNNAALQPPAGGLNDRWLASHAAQISIVPADSVSGAVPAESFGRRPIGCRFEVDSPVMYKGSRLRENGRMYDDTHNCVTYVLTKNAELQAPAGGLNNRWLASHADQISVVSADSVSGARGGRTRRRINRKRKTRK